MSRSGPRPAGPRLARAAAAVLLVSGGAAAASAADPVPSGAGADAGNRLNIGPLEAAMPVSSMLERRYQTVVRQQFDFSCGSAALATLLRHHYGMPVDERVTFLGMWADGDRAAITRLGFSLLDMKRYLRDRGLGADGYRVTLRQIAQARIPGIVLLDVEGYKHFVVVKAVEGRSVLVGDPSLGLRRMSAREFGRAWNGIYFAINGGRGAPPAFNQPLDLALAPSAFGGATLEPVGQAALALTRPMPGDL